MLTPQRRRAFTLVEVIIASSILLGVLYFLSLSVQSMTDQARYDAAFNEAQIAARKVLAQIKRDLANSGGDTGGGGDRIYTHPYSGTNSLPTVTFQIRQNVESASTWSEITQYVLDGGGVGEANAANGIDDDGDGMIDEQRLIRRTSATLSGTNANAPFTTNAVLDPAVTLFEVTRQGGSDLITITIEVARPYNLRGQSTRAEDFARARVTTNVNVLNRSGL